MPEQSLLDQLQPFAISLMIGLIVGIERERSPNETIMGVRTFALMAILGSIAGYLNEVSIFLGFSLLIGILISLGYWRSTKQESADLGLTTEVAAGIVFLLGILSHKDGFLSVVLALLILAILYFRSSLHWLAKDALKPQEIQAAILLAVFSFVIIPFLPNSTIDPWQLINPRALAQVFALLAGIDFLSYALKRLFGARIGQLLSGFLGGFASSTLTYISLSKESRELTNLRSLVGAACFALMSPILLLLAVVYAVSPTLINQIWMPLVMVIVTSFIMGFSFGGKHEKSLPQQDRPVDFVRLVKIGSILVTLLILSAATQKLIGSEAVKVLSFFGGLFELHGVVLANANLHASGNLSEQIAIDAIFLAVLASFVSKLFLIWIFGSKKFALSLTAILGILIFTAGSFYILL